VFSGCDSCSVKKTPVSEEDQLINDYEKHIDDLIIEYTKMSAGDYSVMSAIVKIREECENLKKQLDNFNLTEAQKARLKQIDEKLVF